MMHLSTIIYPGSYQPPIPWRNSNHRGNGSSIVPVFTINRSDSMIIFRCWIPGARREDIQLFIRNHRIHLSVYTALQSLMAKQYDVIRYQLEHRLPMDADTAWFAAEFRSGLMILRFPISNTHFENGTIQVVVY